MYLVAGLALALALLPTDPDFLGLAGACLFRFCFGALGIGYVVLPAALVTVGVRQLGQRQVRAPSVKAGGWALIVTSVCSLANWFLPAKIGGGAASGLYAGGLLGRLLGGAMLQYFSTAGTFIVCLALVAVAVYLLGKRQAAVTDENRLEARWPTGFSFAFLGRPTPGQGLVVDDGLLPK
jgi:uncharacterized membrane protein YfcA